MAAIDISTTQNVTIEYELASLRDRFFAFFIDLMIFLAIYFFLAYFAAVVLRGFITEWGWRFVMLMQLAGLLLYHVLSEISSGGRSWGKKAIGLRVVRLDGQEPGPGDFLMRSLFLVVDFFFSAGVLAAVLITSTLRGQRLGDLASNTTVIRTKNRLHFQLDDILNIQSLDDYEPQFPMVRQLSEADMLLIKNTLSRYQTWRNTAHEQAIKEAVQVVCQQLDLEPPHKNRHLDFLKTLIRDYIVLTR